MKTTLRKTTLEDLLQGVLLFGRSPKAVQWTKLMALFFVLPLMLMSTVWATGWYESSPWENPQTHQWYAPDQAKAEENKKTEVVKKTPEEQFDELQKAAVASRKTAILYPTEANIKDYIAKQEQMMTLSANFADGWRKTLWNNPELDFSLKGRPNNNTAQGVYDAQRTKDRGEAIKQLAGKNGLMFFFKGDCQYCHAMAPTIKSFADRYGLSVMAISLDGGGIADFPNAIIDNGIGTRLGITTVPAVFVANTETREFLPIGYGVMAETDLEERFFAQATPLGTAYSQ
jgi:conjugal transfer pilus assembly protein TraF